MVEIERMSFNTPTSSNNMTDSSGNPDTINSAIQVLPYTDKSCVVTGATYPIKDLLKTAGGKWNNRLKLAGFQKGWIFPRDQMERIRQLINQHMSLTPSTPTTTTTSSSMPAIQLPRPTAVAGEAPVKTSNETTRRSFEENGVQVDLEETRQLRVLVRNGQEITTTVTTIIRTETKPVNSVVAPENE